MELAELIKRVEGLTGADREVDRLLKKVAGAVTIPWRDLSVPYSGLPEIIAHNSTEESYVPFYTASVDAVIQLIGRSFRGGQLAFTASHSWCRAGRPP